MTQYLAGSSAPTITRTNATTNLALTEGNNTRPSGIIQLSRFELPTHSASRPDNPYILQKYTNQQSFVNKLTNFVLQVNNKCTL